MIKNALIITNRVRKIPGGMVECSVRPLQELGYRVFWAADFSIAKFDLSKAPCDIIQTSSRTVPFNPKNILAYRTIKKTIKDKNISLVFCHTPIGGFLGRIAANKMKVPCVIYEAHGFLFFEHGPKLGWLYKMVEQKLARFTNFLITINEEDFENAKQFYLKKDGRCYMVHGSGMHLNFDVLTSEKKKQLKSTLLIDDDTKVLISIGELNSNKNVETLIRALPLLKHSNWILLVCGEGNHANNLRKLAKKYRVFEKVKFLGYRTDVLDLLGISDIYITCSKREGLSRTVSEAMASKVICIVSNRRGMKDLIDDKNGGFLFEPCDHVHLATLIDKSLSLDINEREKMLAFSQNKIQKYTTDVVKKECFEILSCANSYLERMTKDEN